jgi:aconitate hydratase
LVIRLRRADGSIEEIFATHTYNESQIGWFKAGSALNLIRQYQE